MLVKGASDVVVQLQNWPVPSYQPISQLILPLGSNELTRTY